MTRPDRSLSPEPAGITLGEVRALALALPGVTEQGHHDISSFRVGGKIFATVPDDTHLRVMVDEAEIRAAVAEHRTICHELYWGKRLACVVIDLRGASPRLVEDLLIEAWTVKAPASLRSGTER